MDFSQQAADTDVWEPTLQCCLNWWKTGGPTHHWVPSRVIPQNEILCDNEKRRCMHRTNLPECPMFIKSQSCRTVNKTCQGFSTGIAPSIISMGPGDRPVLKTSNYVPALWFWLELRRDWNGDAEGRLMSLVSVSKLSGSRDLGFCGMPLLCLQV